MSKLASQAAPLGESGNITEPQPLPLATKIQALNGQGQADREFFITESELLRRLPVSRRTLYNWRQSGKLPFVRLAGRRVLFHWGSVESALLREQKGAL